MKTFRNFLIRFNVVATTLALGVSSAFSSSQIQNPLDISDSNNSFGRRSTSVGNIKNNKSSYRSPIIFSNLKQFDGKNKFKDEETSCLTNNIYDWVKCASEISSEFKNNFFQEDLVREYFEKKGEIQCIDVSLIKDSYEKTLPEKEALEGDPIFNACMYLIDTNRSQYANDKIAGWSAIGACPEYYQEDPENRDDYDEYEILGDEIGYSDQFRVVGWLLSEALKLTKTLQELYGNEIFENDTFSQQLTIKTVKSFLKTKLLGDERINDVDTCCSIKANMFIFSYMLNRLLFGKWIDVLGSNRDCSLTLNNQKKTKSEFLFERQLCRDAMSYINTAGITAIIDDIRCKLMENSSSVNKTSSARVQNLKDNAVPSVNTILRDLNALYQDSLNTPRGWLKQNIAKDEYSRNSRNLLLSEQSETLEKYNKQQITLEKLYDKTNSLKHFIPSMKLASMKVLDKSGNVLNLLELIGRKDFENKKLLKKVFWDAIPNTMPLKNIDNSSIERRPGDFYYTIQAKNNNLKITGSEFFDLNRDAPVLKNELLLLICESGVIDDVNICIKYFDGETFIDLIYPARSLCREVNYYDELSKAVSIMKEIYSPDYFAKLDKELSSNSERNRSEEWNLIKRRAGEITEWRDSQFSFDENKYPQLKFDSFRKLIITEAKVNSMLDFRLKNLLMKNRLIPDLDLTKNELFIGKKADVEDIGSKHLKKYLKSNHIDEKPLVIDKKDSVQIIGNKKKEPVIVENGKFQIKGNPVRKFGELDPSDKNQLSIKNIKKKRETDNRIVKTSQLEGNDKPIKKEPLVIVKKDSVQIKGKKKESPVIVENGKFQIKGNPVRKFGQLFTSDKNSIFIKKTKKERKNDPLIDKTSQFEIIEPKFSNNIVDNHTQFMSDINLIKNEPLNTEKKPTTKKKKKKKKRNEDETFEKRIEDENQNKLEEEKLVPEINNNKVKNESTKKIGNNDDPQKRKEKERKKAKKVGKMIP